MFANWLKEVVSRIQLQSPKFFVKMRWVCGIIFVLVSYFVGVGGDWLNVIPIKYLFTIPQIIMGGFDVGGWTWGQILSAFIYILATVFAFTFTPVKDISKLNDKIK